MPPGLGRPKPGKSQTGWSKCVRSPSEQILRKIGSISGMHEKQSITNLSTANVFFKQGFRCSGGDQLVRSYQWLLILARW